MSNRSQALSIIVPAHNESSGIEHTITELYRALAGMKTSTYKVLIVDDGSTDGTTTMAQELADLYKFVHLIRHTINRGYEAALKTGIRHAHCPIICITDAAGTYPNQRVPDLLARLSSFDMVIGARTGDDVHIPFIHRPAKWAFNQMANKVAAQLIPNLNSGLRFFRRDTVRRFFPILPDGFSCITTVTLAMLTNGYLVEYMLINYHPRIGQSKIRPIRDTINFIQLVARIALYFMPLKIFLPLSALLMLLAMGWALFSLLVSGQLADVSTFVIAMSSLQVGMVGLLAELINKRIPNTFRGD